MDSVCAVLWALPRQCSGTVRQAPARTVKNRTKQRDRDSIFITARGRHLPKAMMTIGSECFDELGTPAVRSTGSREQRTHGFSSVDGRGFSSVDTGRPLDTALALYSEYTAK